MFAVSSSRISPITSTCGSWRNKWRAARAKSSPRASLTSVCMMPGTICSAGSSTVMMCRPPGSDQMPETRVNGRCFSAARRPGQQQQARGLTQEFFQFSLRVSGKPEFMQIQNGGRTKETQHDLFAGDRRVSRDADVIAGADFAAVNPAILRQRFLIGLQTGKIFDAPENAFGHVFGKFADAEKSRHRGGSAISARCAAHLQMNVAGSGAFGALVELLQNFRSLGLFRVGSASFLLCARLRHLLNGMPE